MKLQSVVRRRAGCDPTNPGAPLLRCAVTGYRPAKLPWGYNENDPRCGLFRQRLRDALEMLIWQGYAHFITGGAIGVDTFAAETILSLRERYPWIALEIAVPCEGQDNCWPEASRKRYRATLAAADAVTLTGRAFSMRAMSVRNHYMVDNADLLLAVWDGRSGGTANTVAYAQSLGTGITRLPPMNCPLLAEAK